MGQFSRPLRNTIPQETRLQKGVARLIGSVSFGEREKICYSFYSAFCFSLTASPKPLQHPPSLSIAAVLVDHWVRSWR